ncbi:hypothetical protein L596_028941 [Steinernema carpocapsae]|uniref:Uncharacterized protein n=1 Tax=Steinernema carpocapsae TaxID=34508 RepID=A0A4U5LZV5_STECR|nr:hypothetical protein L596_028941 [Steinernema carpocapsae]
MARPVARTESVTSEDSLLDFPIAYCEHKIFRDNGSYGKTNVHLTSWSDESTLPDGRLGPPSEFMDGGTATSNEVTAPGNVQITSEVGGKTKTSATVFENVPRSKVVGVTQEEVRRWIRGSCPQTDQLDVDTARMPTIVRTAIRPSMTPTLSSSEATSTEFTSESTGSSASYKSGSPDPRTFRKAS